MELNKPTVGELCRFLMQNFPDDAPVRIEDADTSWTISIIHIDQGKDGVVWLAGAYDEMER